RPDARRPAPDRRAGTRTDARQLPPAGRDVQHAADRLQAVPGVPAEVRLPAAVPAVPDAGFGADGTPAPARGQQLNDPARLREPAARRPASARPLEIPTQVRP